MLYEYLKCSKKVIIFDLFKKTLCRGRQEKKEEVKELKVSKQKVDGKREVVFRDIQYCDVAFKVEVPTFLPKDIVERAAELANLLEEYRYFDALTYKYGNKYPELREELSNIVREIKQISEKFYGVEGHVYGDSFSFKVENFVFMLDIENGRAFISKVKPDRNNPKFYRTDVSWFAEEHITNIDMLIVLWFGMQKVKRGGMYERLEN